MSDMEQRLAIRDVANERDRLRIQLKVALERAATAEAESAHWKERAERARAFIRAIYSWLDPTNPSNLSNAPRVAAALADDQPNKDENGRTKR